MSSRDTNPGFEATSSGKVRTNFSAIGAIIVAAATGTLVVSRYTNSLERTIERFDEKLTTVAERLDSQTKANAKDIEKLRTQVVFRGPFYQWSGQFRYMVITGAKDFPPEPRSFFENYAP